MADEEDLDEGEEGGEGGGGGESSGGKKLIIIIAVILLLVVGGLAAAYYTGALDGVIAMITGRSSTEQNADAETGETGGRAVFYDLEEILVNLNTGGRKSSFLKIRVSLELEKETDVPIIERVMPRIVDNFQVYLRELRIDDLKGSAGMYRLREELLRRVSAATAPAKVKDVLFKEMLVQ